MFRRMGTLSQDDDGQRKSLLDKHAKRIIGFIDNSFNENGIDMKLKLLSKRMKIIRLTKTMMVTLLVKKLNRIMRLQ